MHNTCQGCSSSMWHRMTASLYEGRIALLVPSQGADISHHSTDVLAAQALLETNYGTSWALFLSICSRRSSVRMAGSTCATLEFGSLWCRMAVMNSRSWSSIPFIDTATLETSMGCS